MTGSLARNIVAHYVGLFLMGVANLFVVRLLVQSTGYEAYGIFALGASLVGILQLLELGISGAAVKYIAEWKAQNRWDRLQALWSTGLLMMFILGVIGALLQALVAPRAAEWFHITSNQSRASMLVLYWFALSLVWILPSMIAKSFLEGSQRYDLSNGADALFSFLNAGLLIFFVLRGRGIVVASVIQSVCYLLYFFILLRMVRIELPQLKFNLKYLNLDVLREIRNWSFWNLVRNLASRISWDLDSFIIGIFLSARSVSPYVLGRKFPYIFSAVSWRWVEVFLPLSSHLEAEGKKAELTSIFLKASRFCLAFSLLGAIPLIFFAEPLLILWLGNVSQETVQVQQLVTLSLLLDMSHAVSATLLAGIGQIKRISAYFLFESILNLFLTLLFVRRLGVSGAALATLISSAFVVLLFQIPFGCKIFSVSGKQYFREILQPLILPTLGSALSGLLMIRLAPFTHWAIVIAAFACTTILFAIVFWMTGLTVTERHDAKLAVRKLMC